MEYHPLRTTDFAVVARALGEVSLTNGEFMPRGERLVRELEAHGFTVVRQVEEAATDPRNLSNAQTRVLVTLLVAGGEGLTFRSNKKTKTNASNQKMHARRMVKFGLVDESTLERGKGIRASTYFHITKTGVAHILGLLENL